MHPDAPRVHNVLNPMYWVLGLTGREVERTPVAVSLPGVPAFDAELVRKRTDYSLARPALGVGLPAAAVLELYIAGAPTRIDLSGEEIDARLWFEAQSGLVEPAHQAAAHCGAGRQ